MGTTVILFNGDNAKYFTAVVTVTGINVTVVVGKDATVIPR